MVHVFSAENPRILELHGGSHVVAVETLTGD